MKINTRIIGLAALQASMKRRRDRIGSELKAAVNEVAEEVFSESQRRVPVDTGNLRSSGRLEKAK